MAALLSGCADVHVVAAFVESLVASGRINPVDSVLPIVAALSANTMSKLVVAFSAGGVRFLAQIAPGLMFALTAMCPLRA